MRREFIVNLCSCFSEINFQKPYTFQAQKTYKIDIEAEYNLVFDNLVFTNIKKILIKFRNLYLHLTLHHTLNHKSITLNQEPVLI